MAKTIIQTIGPLYGEVVNGTVFGRPNGSIYVPSSNTVNIVIPDGYEFVRVVSYAYGDRYDICSSGGSYDKYFGVVAESQDTQSYIGTYLEDEDGVQIGLERLNPAGQFNLSLRIIGDVSEDDPALVADDTYYLVAVLYSASGVPIATQKTAIKGVVVS